MSQSGQSPRHGRPATPVSGRYAAGQVLALVLVALVAMPLLPVLVVVVLWLRRRDHRPPPNKN